MGRKKFQRLRLREVEPSGTSTGFGHRYDEHGMPIEAKLVELPTYPKSAQAVVLRQLRLVLNLSLGDAAWALGLHIVDYSDLERGKRVLIGLEDWKRATSYLCHAERLHHSRP